MDSEQLDIETRNGRVVAVGLYHGRTPLVRRGQHETAAFGPIAVVFAATFQTLAKDEAQASTGARLPPASRLLLGKGSSATGATAYALAPK